MNVIKVPTWWNRKDSDLRPNTVDIQAKRVIRTQKELLKLRNLQRFPYSSYALPPKSRQEKEFEKAQQEKNNIYIEIPAAGKRPPSRDQRDKATISEVLCPSTSCPTILITERENELEINSQQENFKTLSALKQGRVKAERKETHEKLEKLIRSKSQLELTQIADFESKVKEKTINLKTYRSWITYKEDPIDKRAPSLKYIEDPPVKTQKKLFEKRKIDFLNDMKKWEAKWIDHNNAEQRLKNREDWFMRLSYKAAIPKVK